MFRMPRRIVLAICLVTTVIAPAPAQTVPTDAPRAGGPARNDQNRNLRIGDADVTAGDRPDPSEPVVELSPFVVNTTQDNGYQATSTLSGTRLNTPLQDVGAAISVYTKNFLGDLGVTDTNQLLIYATGMEAAGAGGNFSASGGDESSLAARAYPQAANRARGLGGPSATREFFRTDIQSDSYNIERVTVNRGPNAALFGVGSAAGVVDTTFLQPDLRRNRNTIMVRYGNNDALRSTADFNRVLIGGKLAARIALLREREEFNQRPAFEDKKRIYGALTFEPYRSTALRFNFESGNTYASRPITVLPYNSIPTAWYADGRPGFDWSFYDDPARNPNAAAQAGGSGLYAPPATMGDDARITDRFLVVYRSPDAQTPAYAYRASLTSSNGNLANTIKNQIFNPLVNRDLASDAIRWYATRNINQLPGAYWVGANVLPGQQSGQVPAGIRSQGFTDFSAFDFKNRMIDETARQSDSFHTFKVLLEQRAWEDRVGIELAYDRQRIDRRSRVSFFGTGNDNHIRLDTNATLPTGQPNPDYGRPYAVTGSNRWTNDFSDREGKRATGFLKYDFKDLRTSWTEWLGRHTVTGLYEESAQEYIAILPRFAVDGEAARALSPTVNAGNRWAPQIAYLGPSLIGNSNSLRLESVRIPSMALGPAPADVSNFVRKADATDPGAFVNQPFSYVEIVNAGSNRREVIKSRAVVLQSYWLRDHLITLFGWRRDEDYFVRQITNFQPNPADPNDPGKTRFGFNDLSFPSTPPLNVAGEVKSYSVVLRWPRKLIKLPTGTDLSVFYNESESFSALGGRVTPFGESLPSPQGKTKEYGFNFWAFRDKLFLRINWFETGANAQSVNLLGQAFVPAVITRAGIWATEANNNPHLAAQSQADIDLLFSTLPANYRDLYGLQITGTAPNITYASNTNLAGATDTTDLTAKGTELDLTFNPTNNWRILLNVARQETVLTNSYPQMKRFVALMRPVWDKLSARPAGNYPLNWQPGDPLPANVQTFGTFLDVNVYVPLASMLATEGTASAEQRKWRANLVTNYTFSSDASFLGINLKGWGCGAGIRWQDKIGIGYPTSRDPKGSVAFDLEHPIYSPAETNVDAWVSYQRRFWNNRINWSVQLNVSNLYGQSDPIAIYAQPWGEDALVRLAPERRWYLTNTFRF